MTLSRAMFLIPDSIGEGRKGNEEGGGKKGQVQCEKCVFGRRMDLLREKRPLQWFLSLRMKVEVCVNFHALCFEGEHVFLRKYF